MRPKVKLLCCLLAPPLFAVTLELVIRAFDAAPPPAPPMYAWNAKRQAEISGGPGQYQFHPQWLWEPRPGVVIDGDPINAECFRGPLVSRERRAPLRIAVIGESSAFGMGVRDGESWPRVLEQRLRAGGVDAEVLNFAVVGHTLAQGRALYLGRARDFRPNVLIACYACINELSLAPSSLSDSRKMQCVQSPAFHLRMLLDRFASLRWLAALGGVTVAPEALVVGDAHGTIPRVDLAEVGALLAQLRVETRSDGAELMLVVPARAPQSEVEHPVLLDYTRAFVERARELEVPLADARSVFNQRAAEPGAPPLFLDYWHPTPAGHELCAGVVAATLERAGLLERARGGQAH